MDPVSLFVLLALGLGAIGGTAVRVRSGSKPQLWLYNDFDKKWRHPGTDKQDGVDGRPRRKHSDGDS